MKKSKKTLFPLFYKKKPRRPLSEKQKKLLKFNLKKFLFKTLNEKKEIMEILLQDERYNFINYNEIKNLLNIEQKNNKFNLYSKIYKIEKLRKPLLDYINLKEEDKEYIKMIKLNEF